MRQPETKVDKKHVPEVLSAPLPSKSEHNNGHITARIGMVAIFPERTLLGITLPPLHINKKSKMISHPWP